MIDQNLIIAPISQISPCGEDMSFSREFDQIHEARREDDPTLDQGEWVTARKEAEWSLVVNLCEKLLSEKSKDIRLLMWLTEALSKTHGFAGLAQGYQLMAKLIDCFWEHIHPLPEDNDQENRIGNLSWLANRSARLVQEISIIESSRGCYSMGDYETARLLQATLDRDPENAEKLAADKITLAQIDIAQRETPPAFYIKLVQDTKACVLAIEELESASNGKLELDSPSFTAARDAILDVVARVNHFASVTVATDNSQATTSETIQSGTSPFQNTIALSGEIISRKQALQQLRVIADYFRHTEPHSPVAYLADKAASWAEMPLHAWLQTVVKDKGALAHIEELLGIADIGAIQNPG